VFSTKTKTELSVMSALDAEQQQRMNDDLRTVLVALEGRR